MIRLRTMSAAADIDLGMRLKAQAGWNQLSADWRRMLAMQPEGCFVAEWDGVAVGTSVCCVFGRVAWIAMMLVDASVRGRGIGKALMQHAVAFANAQGATSVRLDATPLGQPLYEKLGFVPQYSLTRFAGRVPAATQTGSADGVKPVQSVDVQAILDLDRAATNTDRSKFLRRLLQEQPDRSYAAVSSNQLSGFVTMRPGSNAWQVGPCVADADVGGTLLQHACRQLAGEPIFMDIPEPNEPAVHWAARAGLQSQRRLVRMCRGEMVNDDTSLLWASSGPELG